VVPPFIDQVHLDPLVAKIKNVSQPKDLQWFLDLVFSDLKPLPNWVMAGMTSRFVHAQKLLHDTHQEYFRKRLLALNPAQVRVIVGQKDRLFPESQYDQAFAKQFKSSFRYIPCGHDAAFACQKEIGQAMFDATQGF
jgi:hypothetical protein